MFGVSPDRDGTGPSFLTGRRIGFTAYLLTHLVQAVHFNEKFYFCKRKHMHLKQIRTLQFVLLDRSSRFQFGYDFGYLKFISPNYVYVVSVLVCRLITQTL